MKGIIKTTALVAMVAMVASVYGAKYQINYPNLPDPNAKPAMKKSMYVTLTNNSKKVKTAKIERYRLKGAAGAKDLQDYVVNPGQSVIVQTLPASQLSKVVFKDGSLSLKYEEKATKTLYVDNDMKKPHVINVFVDGTLLEEATLAKHMTGASKKEYDLTGRQVQSITCTGTGKSRIDLITKQ